MIKYKFSKLEKLLISLIVLFMGYFLFKNINNISLDFIPEPKSKLAVEKKFTKIINYLNEGKFAKYYDSFSTAERNKMSKDFAIKELSKIGKKEIKVIINEIVLDHDIALVDSSTIACSTKDCLDKKTIRDVKKLIYEKNHWYLTTDVDTQCIRTEPYSKPPEFDRAISLISQRIEAKWGKDNLNINNCYDIQYASLDDAEGYFLFDPKNSSMDKLTILVDNSYKYKDDLTTAFLLAHELNHARNYVTSLNNGSEISCFDDEISSFQNQLLFLGALNEDEQNSIVGKLFTTDIKDNNQLLLIDQFIKLSGKALSYCKNQDVNTNECYSRFIDEQISDMVRNNPYYQKQCSASE